MFDTKTNSNMPNSMMVFTFSVSHGKAFFSADLVQNSKIVSLSWIMAHRLINDVNMHYSMVVFTFSVLDQKNSFRANLVQNLNILSLSENFAPTPIQIWKIYWQCYCLCFRLETYFWENLDNTKCQFQLKFGTKTSSNTLNSMVVFTFYLVLRKQAFLANSFQKITIIIFSWNLAARIIRIRRI